MVVRNETFDTEMIDLKIILDPTFITMLGVRGLKVPFIQKGLMCLSFLQTDEPNYFPELEV